MAGVTWDTIPRITAYVGTDGKNNLCYNYILGKCNPRYCHHRTGHAGVADITDEFAEALCAALQPGFDAMTEDLARLPWMEFKAAVANRPTARPTE